MAGRLIVINGLPEALHHVLFDPKEDGARNIIVGSMSPRDAAAFKELVAIAGNQELAWNLVNNQRVEHLIRASGVLVVLHEALLPATLAFPSEQRVLNVIDTFATQVSVRALGVGGSFFHEAQVLTQHLQSFVRDAGAEPAPEWCDVKIRVDALLREVKNLLEGQFTLAQRN